LIQGHFSCWKGLASFYRWLWDCKESKCLRLKIKDCIKDSLREIINIPKLYILESQKGENENIYEKATKDYNLETWLHSDEAFR